MVGIWAWRLRSCVYAFAEKGRRAVKQLRPSRREKRRETIALMTAFLTNPGVTEPSQKRWAGSDCAPNTCQANHLFSFPRKPVSLRVG